MAATEHTKVCRKQTKARKQSFAADFFFLTEKTELLCPYKLWCSSGFTGLVQTLASSAISQTFLWTTSTFTMVITRYRVRWCLSRFFIESRIQNLCESLKMPWLLRRKHSSNWSFLLELHSVVRQSSTLVTMDETLLTQESSVVQQQKVCHLSFASSGDHKTTGHVVGQ